MANGIVLPYSIAYNAERSELAANRYENLASFVGASDLEQIIIELKADLSVPARMHDILPDQDVFEAQLDELVQKVLSDVCTPANPVEVSSADARMLLRRVYYGA